jgi:peroxiredoxin
MVKPGDKLPDVALLEGQPDYKPPVPHSLGAICKGKTVAIFAVPGAFTPGCSQAHLPSFIKHYDELVAAGVDTIVCTATNDPFVMVAWGQMADVKENTILMLSDAEANLCRALGVAGGSATMVRSARYALLAKDGVITHFFPAVKEDGEKCPGDTYAPSILAALKK